MRGVDDDYEGGDVMFVRASRLAAYRAVISLVAEPSKCLSFNQPRSNMTPMQLELF